MAEKYSPEEYVALDIDEYRRRFPEQTAKLTDNQLFDIVMGTDDDMDDEGWIALFNKAA